MDTIYLDNAATTWPKPEQVYRGVDTAMREHGAKPRPRRVVTGPYEHNSVMRPLHSLGTAGAHVSAARGLATLTLDLCRHRRAGCARSQGIYGPRGIGVLVLATHLPVEPWREGGTGFRSELTQRPAEYPWPLEGGICNLPGIAGLRASISFITGVDETAGIAVRSGLHCSPAAHQALGTLPTGTVRASFGQFNTREHAEALVAAAREVGRGARPAAASL